MPKRTNAFQKLVYLFKQQLAGVAEVTESKELLDRVTGARVEVDVCIETVVGTDRLIIGVECTKRGRTATLGWVNEMLSKHETLPTNLLVLASGSGFVKNAEAKAYSKGAKLISLKEVSDATVKSLIGEIASVALAVVEVSRKEVLLRLAAVDEHPAMVTEAVHDFTVYAQDGTKVETVSSLCESLRATAEFGKLVESIPVNEKGEFTIEWRPLYNGALLYLQSDTGALHPIDQMRIVGTVERRTTELKVWNQSLEKMQIAWAVGKAPFFGEEIVMVRTTDSSGQEQVSGTIGPIVLPPQSVDVASIVKKPKPHTSRGLL
jgi:hypothetical protein